MLSRANLSLPQGFPFRDSHCLFISVVFIQVVATGNSIMSILAVNEGITLKHRNLKQIPFLNRYRSITSFAYNSIFQTMDYSLQ